jgi:pimeloyl-ACP methyl ester carboxylesterase
VASAEYAIRSAFSGERDYEKEIWKHVPKAQGPFAKGRISQRLSEANRLSKGHLLEKIKNIKCPITYISGQLDSIFPPGTENDEKSQLSRVIKSVEDKTRFNSK